MKRFISLELLFTLLLLFFTLSTFSQEVPYDPDKKYILGGLEVTGLLSYNEQTVKTYTGLRVGQPISFRGDQISAVIKKLWGLELFSDIEFFVTRVEGGNYLSGAIHSGKAYAFQGNHIRGKKAKSRRYH